jgi:hypothetical protein
MEDGDTGGRTMLMIDESDTQSSMLPRILEATAVSEPQLVHATIMGEHDAEPGHDKRRWVRSGIGCIVIVVIVRPDFG